MTGGASAPSSSLRTMVGIFTLVVVVVVVVVVVAAVAGSALTATPLARAEAIGRCGCGAEGRRSEEGRRQCLCS